MLDSTCVWHRYLLALTRLSNRDQIVSELYHTYNYYTLIQHLSSAWNRRFEKNNFGRMLDDSFFPSNFHTNSFTVFRRMIVSSEKIICSQFVALFYLESIFSIDLGKYNGFDKGRLLIRSLVDCRSCLHQLVCNVSSCNECLLFGERNNLCILFVSSSSMLEQIELNHFCLSQYYTVVSHHI